MKTDRSFFYRLKTATMLILLLTVSLVTMLRVHPVVSLLSMCSGALSLLLYGGRGELRALLRFCLPVGLLLILFNLAFNRNGVTVLFYIGDAAVTLESILYALFTAFAFCGAVLWFSFFCAFLDSDRVYRLFARFSKGLAVIFSLSLALVPKILEKYETGIKDLVSVDEVVSKLYVEKKTAVKVAQNTSSRASAGYVNTNTTTSSGKTSLGISLIRPISGTITSRFGARSSIRSSAHTGLDISAPTGTPIKAAASGTVTFAGWKGSY